MCQYCGCRAMPLIRDYVAEHDRVLDLLDGALRAAAAEDSAGAASRLCDAQEALRRHWTGEENGIFSVMAAREEEYARYVAPLVDEHRELDLLLAQLDISEPDDTRRLRAAYEELGAHISKEEDGLFPASLTALDGEDWNSAMTAWQEAHPGETLIAD